MQRIPEPELMDDEAQARAYAYADFESAHSNFIRLFQERFSDRAITGTVLDLGCGPGDIARRFARAYPDTVVHGVDGAAAMLRYGDEITAAAPDVAGRVRLFHGLLPGAQVPLAKYDAIISNSLLHHLHDPCVLWHAVRQYAASGAPMFVMDLMRPPSRDVAQVLTDTYVAGEPEVLRRDFHNSLLAAFEPDEVRAQLQDAGLDRLQVEVVTDRHLIVWGEL